MVGPSSLARPTQDVVHELIGDRQARGWHYQVHDEPVFNLAWDRTWRLPLVTLPGGFGVDALPTLTLAAGTVQTYAAAGGRLRIGQGLKQDFGPPRIRPAIADMPAPVGEGFGWYLFVGAGGRAVAHESSSTATPSATAAQWTTAPSSATSNWAGRCSGAISGSATRRISAARNSWPEEGIRSSG